MDVNEALAGSLTSAELMEALGMVTDREIVISGIVAGLDSSIRAPTRKLDLGKECGCCSWRP